MPYILKAGVLRYRTLAFFANISRRIKTALPVAVGLALVSSGELGAFVIQGMILGFIGVIRREL